MQAQHENSHTGARTINQGQLLSTANSLYKTPLALAIATVLSLSTLAYAAPGDPVGSEFRVNTSRDGVRRNPAIAQDDDGDFVVAWRGLDQGRNAYSVYAQRYNAAGKSQGSEFQVHTTTTGNHSNPAIALDDDGDFVVVWQCHSYIRGGNLDICAQRYSAAGMPRGGEFQVDNITNDSHVEPAIAMDDDGDFVVTWASTIRYGSDGFDIYAQRYSAAGMPQGSKFRVNTSIVGSQFAPDIALDADGDFVVTWINSADNHNIYAQRYSAAGVSRGSEFRVNTSITGSLVSAISLDADGDFVVTWGGRDDIYSQRYSAAGMPRGEELRIKTRAREINHGAPDIALDDDGDFVVTWSNYFVYNSRYGDADISAQRYSAAGMPLGEEFRVNTTVPGLQFDFDPAISLDADGDFVVAWTHYFQSSNPSNRRSDIYAQRYTNAAEPTSLIFPLKQTPNLNYTGAYTRSSITSVLDHSLKVNIEPFYAYGSTANGRGDGVIQGVSGEQVNTRTSGGVICGVGEMLLPLNGGGGTRLTKDPGPCGDGSTSYDEHPGYDYTTGGVANVHAAEGGTVVNAGGQRCHIENLGYTCAAWGAIGIEHADGYITQYFHLSEIESSLAAGAEVAQGQLIGKTGNTAPPERPVPHHLHFEILKRVSDRLYIVDPYGWQGGNTVDKLYSVADVPPKVLWKFEELVTRKLGAGSGSIKSVPYSMNCSSICTIDLPNASVIVLEASPAAGSAFSAWTGCPSINGNTCTVTMDAAKSVSATFNFIPPTFCGGLKATLVGTSGNDTLTGTAGNDVITGLDGNDIIDGLGGNDTLCGGPGNDRLTGGTGIDTADFAGTVAVRVDLTVNTASGQGSDTLGSIENVTGSSAADTLIGNPGNNVLKGGLGNDTMYGEGGFDTASFTGPTAVMVNLTNGTATGQGNDSLFNFEYITGSSGNDTLIGNAFSNILSGLGGNDNLNGMGGTDYASFQLSLTPVTANLTSNTASGEGSDTLSNIEGLVGSNLNDTLTGNNGPNILFGQSGNDILNGGFGNDTLDGGAQIDTCNGDAQIDTAVNCESVTGVP